MQTVADGAIPGANVLTSGQLALASPGYVTSPSRGVSFYGKSLQPTSSVSYQSRPAYPNNYYYYAGTGDGYTQINQNRSMPNNGYYSGGSYTSKAASDYGNFTSDQLAARMIGSAPYFEGKSTLGQPQGYSGTYSRVPGDEPDMEYSEGIYQGLATGQKGTYADNAGAIAQYADAAGEVLESAEVSEALDIAAASGGLIEGG